MHLTILTPLGALVALAAVVPLAAWLVAARRVRRAREALGLRPPARRELWVPAVLVLTLALVGAAAAQPVLSGGGGRGSGRSGQALVVLDTSESMRAGRRSRFNRAVAAAARVRAGLPQERVGLASMTDRVLPHLFPTRDLADYRATLASSIGIDRPPPGHAGRLASGYDDLAEIGVGRFFVGAGPRVAIVLTDGESRAFAAGAVARALATAHVRVVLVRFWRPGERIANDRVYRADPSSLPELQSLAAALGTRVYDENDLGGAIDEARRDLATAARTPVEATAGARPLAPYALLAACAPLGLLLVRRLT